MMVEITEPEWAKLRQQLIDEYGISIFLSWRMKAELGCVRRFGVYPSDMIYLDFFDEINYTTFILRYS
jgi:hypothetical protein